MVVDYTKRESYKLRGWTIAGSLVTQNVGAGALYLLVGFGLNSPAFGGTFCGLSLTYRHILMFYLATCAIGIINSLFFTYDIPVEKTSGGSSIKIKLKKFWILMQDRVFQRCAVIFMLSPALRLQSSGAVKIRKNWAEVQPLAGSVNATWCAILSAVAVGIYQRFFTNKNWVHSYISIKVIFLIVTLLVDAATIFDVIRSQYFFFLEDMADGIHTLLGACILMQLAAEISGQGLEALTFSMFMSNWTIMSITGRMICNLISVPFNVIGDERYQRDAFEDRIMVFGSVVAIFLVNVLCLAVIFFLCPKQKQHLHDLKEQLGKSEIQARIYFTCFVLLYLFSFLYLVLMMNKSYQCWIILGGNGC